jgi:hypothetical protein
MIWKTVLKLTDVQQIKVPAGAEILCAREQNEQICVWYRCDPRAPDVHRTLHIVGTGNGGPSDAGRYLGTASLRQGQLIFHVFEMED